MGSIAGISSNADRNIENTLTPKELAQFAKELLTKSKDKKKYKISLQSPSGIASFSVGKESPWSGWKKQLQIFPNDTIYFDMHYFANIGDARNIRVTMNYLHNKILSKGDSIIHFKAWADNAGEIFDSVTIKSNQEVLLKLVGSSWQKNQCQSTSCQSSLLNSQTGYNGMRSEGILVGDIPKNQYGNVVLKFSVIEIPKTKMIDETSKLVKTIK